MRLQSSGWRWVGPESAEVPASPCQMLNDNLTTPLDNVTSTPRSLAVSQIDYLSRQESPPGGR
jgi:hypothetical protein